MAQRESEHGRPARGLSTENLGPMLPEPAADDADAVRVVPALRLVARSWAVFLANLDVFVMLMWRPFALSAAAACGAVLVADDIGVAFAAALYTLVTMVAVVPVITAWHRMILLGADNPDAHIVYRAGAAEWTYLKAAALLYGLGYVVGLVVNAIYGPLLGGGVLWLVREGYDPFGLLAAHGAALVRGLSVACIVGFLVARFFLVLPAAAIGVRCSFAESALATRRNGVRLLFAYVLASVPPLALSLLFESPFDVLTSDAGTDVRILLLVLGILPRILLYTIAVGILSFAFEQLVGVPRRLRR